uniref:Uncharacterized protein n=1 Tax=Panagrolaimus sp. ES5 TaxID=591445 RepID=A0AC34GV93_9BILA
MVAASDQCFCVHIRTCAIVVGIIGVMFGILQCLTALFIWWYIPMSLFILSSYSLLLRGVYSGRPKLLTPAQVTLGINLVISFIMIIALIILGFVLPDDVVYVLSSYDDYYYDYEAAQDSTRLFLFLLAFIIFVASSYNIFAFIIIYRAKKWLLQNPTITYPAPAYPYGYNNAPPPPPPMQQQSFQHPPMQQPQQPKMFYTDPSQQPYAGPISGYQPTGPPQGYNAAPPQQYPQQCPPQNPSQGYNIAPPQQYYPQQQQQQYQQHQNAQNYSQNNPSQHQYRPSPQPTPQPDYDVKF